MIYEHDKHLVPIFFFMASANYYYYFLESYNLGHPLLMIFFIISLDQDTNQFLV